MAKLSYDSAIVELQAILDDLQGSETKIDTLSKKITRAKELLTFCKTHLRSTEEEIASFNEEEPAP